MKTLLRLWLALFMGVIPWTAVWAAPTIGSQSTPTLSGATVRQALAPLVATVGTPTSYRITTVPSGGTLYVNGTAVTAARTLTPTEATQLTFMPSGTAGNYPFQFTATDGTGTSAAATYNIPVSLSGCGGGSFDFSTRPANENWTAQSNVAASNGVTISTSGYSAGAGTNRFQIGNDQGGAQSTSLSWYALYTSRGAANATSTVTFTFSKALTGFSIVVQDIDANTTNGNYFIDQVQFDGYVNTTTTTPIALSASDVKLGSTNTYSGSNRVTGNANSAATPADNVVVTFPQAITKLTLTYRNTQGTTNLPTQQAIGIPAFSWCASSDIATTFTGPARAQAGSTVTYTINTANNGADVATSVTPTLQLPTGLTNITSANGGTYNASTGLITFPTISEMTVGAIFGNTVTFTMPANNAVTGTATFTSPVTDNVATNNSVTLTTAQNRPPVANNVTNSPAILNSSGATAIAPLSATDPDGDASLVRYTLATLPAASEGTLYVNGTAATAGQTLTPAQISQLSFAPVGTFTGNSTFTFNATDDAGVTSNTATYTVPVTAGADLSTVIAGSTLGVEGQGRVYSATTTNLSSATATNVVTTITLSNKPPFSSVSVTNGSYDASTGVVTFNPVNLAGGERILQTINFIAQPSPATITGTARSTSNTADPNANNNNGSLANATITTTITPVGPAASASAVAPCANPGRDGSPTLTANPNAYYPGTSASGTSVTIGAAASGGAQTAIAAGDLVLIMQMQGGDFNSDNTDSYGDGVAGGLASGNLNTNFTAGQYEYAVANSAVSTAGGTLTLTTSLRNTYSSANATSTSGQRRFQVIRVPQYADLTLGADLTALPWNGSTGGVLVLDVAGRMSFGTTTKYVINATAAGFRGGAGRALGGATGLAGNDYRTAATAAANAMKGEGIVGTPRYVNNGTASFDTGTDGYPNGSAGRGAPGNAGGGGTDANPSANNQNSGGGGGGNGARGGRGGNSATANTAVGGELGSTFGPPSTSRLILGGGGGAGVSSTANGASGYASSGAAGGGLVMLRTGSISGRGSIVANGASATASGNDGSGGGGAGGSILVTASNTASLGSLTLTANGGSGGSNTGTTARGPGGGGGGGIILANASVANATTAAGQNGLTTGNAAYGAEAGVAGFSNTQVSPSIANSTAGINCSVDVVAALTGPATATAGQTVTLSAVFSNNGGVAASNVTRTITLPVVVGVQAPGSESVVTDNDKKTTTITYPALTTLAAGASNSFGLSYTAPGTASVTATAQVATSTTPEPVTANNMASVTTTISGDADVTTALAGLTSLNAGRRSGIYSVVFANNGPAAASTVTRRVTLPAGIDSLTVMGGASYTYDKATGILDFGTVASLNSRAADVFQFWFVSPATGTTATLSSAVTTATSQGNNAASDSFTLTAKLVNVADVESQVTADTPTVAPGQMGQFTVKFLNNGPSTSTGVLRRVQLPAGLQNVTASNGGTYDPATGIVTYAATADLPVGGNANSVITFTAPATGPVVATANMNDATIFSGQSNNNQATGRINVTPLADVATSLSGPTTSVAGNLVTYSVLTSNNGPSVATDVVQKVQLPANLAGVFASNGGVYDANTGVVTFPTLATLPSGAVRNNTVSLAMPSMGFAAKATVATATTETTTNNNTATAATTASTPATTEQANVYTTINFSTREVAPGAATTFTVVTGNNGPQPAANVVQQVALPPGLTGVTVSNSGSYDAVTGIVTFPAVGSLVSGTSVSNTITVNVPNSGTLLALASVSSTTSDPMPADNQQPALVTVLPITDVATTLIGPSTASAGQQLTLTVNTINNGPITATNVVQTVTIPAGLAPADVAATGSGTYDPLTGVVTFPALPTQAVGNVATNTITYKMPAYRSTDGSSSAASRTFENRATVTTTSPENVKTNNVARALTEVKWNSDVAVAVSGPSTTLLGNPVLYTVSTINNGPAPTDTVRTTVRIVTGLTGVVVSGGGTYDAATGIVTFPPILRQPAGAAGAVTNTISFIVPDRPIIGVAAVANTSRTTNDANLTNNASTLISPVQPATATQVDLQTTITSNVSQQTAGQPVQLTVTATNAGTSSATGRSRVSLPAGLSNVVVRTGSSTGTVLANVYDAKTGTVTLPPVDQAAGTSSTYVITVNDPGSDPLVATASINSTLSDPKPENNNSSVTVNIVPAVDVATRLSGPATLLPGSNATYQVVTVNNGPSAASSVVQKVQLPTGLTGVIISGGGTYDQASGVVTFPTLATQAVGVSGEVTNTISFAFPTSATTLTASVSTTTTEIANSAANNTATLTTALAQQPPVANTRANRLQTPQGNTADALLVSALTGYDPVGNLASYKITALPDSKQGTLLLNGAAVTAGQTIGLADISKLTFDPASSFVGNAFFSYSTTTKDGVESTTPALYTITVGYDNPAVYATTPVKGSNGAGAYQNNDVLANVQDVNGSTYNASAEMTNNGVRAAQVASGSTLPDGVAIAAESGQLYVSDRSLLVAGTYTVNIKTTDAYGGITTQPVTFAIGTNPLPVELTAFSAQTQQRNAVLTWKTASEKNNDHFVVERSTNGRTFVAVGTVRGHGSTTQAHAYSFVDEEAARQGQLLYYRLRQVDTDSAAQFSVVRTVSFPLTSVTLYPNPATTATTLDLRSLPTGIYRVAVTDMMGRTVRQYTGQGGTEVRLELNELSAASYIVTVEGDGTRLRLRLVKE